jgi:hypothetical protein
VATLLDSIQNNLPVAPVSSVILAILTLLSVKSDLKRMNKLENIFKFSIVLSAIIIVPLKALPIDILLFYIIKHLLHVCEGSALAN